MLQYSLTLSRSPSLFRFTSHQEELRGRLVLMLQLSIYAGYTYYH